MPDNSAQMQPGTRSLFLNQTSKRYNSFVLGKKDESNSATHFHVSSNWLDEDFEETIISYPTKIPKIENNIPQCSKLPPILVEGPRVKKSSKLKIEPETSQPAIHNLGLFLTAVEEDNESDPKPKQHFWSGLKRKSRVGLTYCAKEMPYFEDIDS